MNEKPEQNEEVIHQLGVPSRLEGLRLSEFLLRHVPSMNRPTVFRLIKSGKVSVNDHPVTEDSSVRAGQQVSFQLRQGKHDPVQPKIDFDVLHEDDRYVVINKPAGEVVTPGRDDDNSSVMLALRKYFVDAGNDEAKPRIVHRLDRDTTGAVIVAKTLEAQRWLTEQFKERHVDKKYLAVVDGEVYEEEGEVDLKIRPAGRRSTKMRVHSMVGREALTLYRVLEKYRGYTLLEVIPKTGRTHQIRLHLSAIGYPLLIDPMYGAGAEIFLSSIKRKYRAAKGRPEQPIMARLTLHAASEISWGIVIKNCRSRKILKALPKKAVTQSGFNVPTHRNSLKTEKSGIMVTGNGIIIVARTNQKTLFLPDHWIREKP